MLSRIACLLMIVLLVSCETKIKTENAESTGLPITGTWKLLTGTLIEKGDTTVTDYTKSSSFIKIINDSHFSFITHDLTKGKDTAAASFSAGAGTYSLKDSTYTEHLEYCSAREWEGHDFTFTVTIHNDTLIQRGIEIVEKAGINRLNIEKYIRIKK